MSVIFYEKQEHKAPIKAIEVKAEYQADILVYLCKSDHEAKEDFLWFLTDKEYKASSKICWVTQEHKADLKVFFVKDKYRAKWNSSHKLQKRL